jgi:hypothetical protein
MSRLREAGISISFDWTDCAFKAGPTLEEELKFALLDLRGVEMSDLLWLAVPDIGGCGCFIEMGYALACGKAVVVSGPHRTIFDTLKNCKCFQEHDEALEAIIGIYNKHKNKWPSEAALSLGNWRHVVYDELIGAAKEGYPAF